MNRRRFLMLSAALPGLSAEVIWPAMSFAKDGGDDGGGSGSGSGDDGGSSGSGSGDDGGSSGSGSGDDGDSSGHGSSGGDDKDPSGSRSGHRDGHSRETGRNGRDRGADDGRAHGPSSVDTVALSYGDGSRESVVEGRYARLDRNGGVAEDRPATHADLARLAHTNLGGARRGELLLRMDSRSGAVELVDRRGWRETMNGGRYSLTDPSGSLVRTRQLRPDDLARVRALLTR